MLRQFLVQELRPARLNSFVERASESDAAVELLLRETSACRGFTQQKAKALVDKFIANGDDSIFAEATTLITRKDEGVFAVMQGSGNEPSIFGKALHLFRKAGFLIKAEALAAIDRLG